MKALFTLSLLISYSAFAQNLQMEDFKKLLSQNQKTLESVYPGMSKKITSVTKFETEKGICEVEQTATQTVLSLEGDKIIVFSKESQKPQATETCEGFETASFDVLFYEAKPNLEADLNDLNSIAKDVKKISRQGNFVTLEMNESTYKYDLTKSSFKNIVSYQDKYSTATTSDIGDIDVNSFDLTKVLFCDSADSDECVEGDFSDILF